MFKYLVSSWEYCLGRIGRRGLVGGGTSLEADFEVSLTYLVVALFMCGGCLVWSLCYLLLTNLFLSKFCSLLRWSTKKVGTMS